MSVRAVLLLLAACGGSAPAASPVAPESQPEKACKRAIECGIFEPQQLGPCLACLAQLARQSTADEQRAADDYRLDAVSCELLKFAARVLSVSECTAGRWYGP